MGRGLRTPDEFEIPTEINEWEHDPEPYNGEAWFGPDREQSVVAFNHFGSITGCLIDERCSGMENKVRFVDREIKKPDDLSVEESRTQDRRANARLVKEVVDWMRRHRPGEVANPRVNEAVFDAPVGYELASYRINQRDTMVVYRRREAEEADRLAGVGEPDCVSPDSFPYLVIETWAGSGNSTVSLSPLKGAHDHEMAEIVETPEGCGIEVAVAMAHQWARENVDETAGIGPMTGQTDLLQFAKVGQ